MFLPTRTLIRFPFYEFTCVLEGLIWNINYRFLVKLTSVMGMTRLREKTHPRFPINKPLLSFFLRCDPRVRRVVLRTYKWKVQEVDKSRKIVFGQPLWVKNGFGGGFGPVRSLFFVEKVTSRKSLFLAQLYRSELEFPNYSEPRFVDLCPVQSHRLTLNRLPVPSWDVSFR